MNASHVALPDGRRTTLQVVVLTLLLATGAAAQSGPLQQTQADAYTRYELQSPESATFRIVYDVTATTPGARVYFNPIRRGSEPTVHGVTDRATGKALEWRLVEGRTAREEGLEGASEDMQYLRVTLAEAVPRLEVGEESVSPSEGEARLRIDKSYRDPASYFAEGERVVFERSLGVTRNAVVLPASYELVAANYPVQVAREQDGRIRVSFMNRGPAPVPLRLEARQLAEGAKDSQEQKAGDAGSLQSVPPITRSLPAGARPDFSFDERAFQDREIVYFLDQPESHSFRLYHDYTETRPGVDRYLNVVRPGSKASRPEAWNLDTGKRLRVETLVGAAISEKGLDPGQPIAADTEVVVIWFEPVAEGASTRLRIEETYTDPTRYGLVDGELLWDRSFGRSRNVVVLPAGWTLTHSAVPAVIDETEDGRARLSFENDRPGVIDVFLRARRR